MPLPSGGRKTLWIMSGFFLLYSVLIVTAAEVSLPTAAIYPAVYCLYARRVPFRWPLLIACIPLALAAIPAYTSGVFLYGVLLVSATAMHLFLRKGSIGLAVGVPSALIFAIVMASVYSISQENGMTVRQVIAQWADAVAGETLIASREMLSGEELREFQGMITVMRERIIALFPSMVLTGSAFVLWLNLIGISLRERLSLRDWKSPDWLIGGFILAGVLTVIPMGNVPDVGLNLLIIVGEVYFFQGLAIVSVFMGERGWPPLIRWPLYILILIQIYMMVIVAGLGLFDAWFDFRKRIRTPKGDRE